MKTTMQTDIENIYRANFPNAYVPDGLVDELIQGIKVRSGNRLELDELRKAMADLSEANPHKCPNVHEISRQVRNNRDQGRNRGISDTSASNFLEHLRAEHDPRKRWTLICQASSDVVRAGVGYLYDGEDEKGNSRWSRNPAHLYCEHDEDPCARAQALADRHGIEYTRFSPIAEEAAMYLEPVNHGER